MSTIGEMKEPVAKASRKLLGMLNEAVARELQVSIQYMWQHVERGAGGSAAHGELRRIAIADRLYCLGGTPTTQPNPVFVGSTPQEMFGRDVEEEKNAERLYRQIIKTAQAEDDETTAQLFRGILEQEEGHHAVFASLLKTVQP